MKLDYETLQFERQLKRAKRLSLLDYAATERRRKQECKKPISVGPKKSPRARSTGTNQVVSQAKQIESRPQQVKRTVSEAVNKLKRSAARRIAGRRRLCPRTKRRNVVASRSQMKQHHVSNAESHQFIDMEGCSQLALVDLEAKLEIISSSSLGNSHSTSTECIASKDRSNCVVRETKLPQPSFRRVDNYIAPPNLGPRLDGFYRYIEKTAEELDDEVEYDMDEEDFAWLKLLNDERRRMGKPIKFPPLSPDTFERLMDRFEKEAHQVGQDSVVSGKQVNVHTGASTTVLNEDDAVCNICGDDECTNTNAILFCDSCNLAVHQECYGVPYVPEGQWLCRRCQAGVSSDVACCLCPVRGGAIKRTNDRRWAHVVCALWIPEVGFGSIELLEPITKLDHLPPARRRLTCAVCSQSNVGACVQCMRKHCYKAFHITCAQQVGLYMKIEPVFDASGMMINVSKTLLCDNHKPAGARPFQPMIDNSVDDDGRPPAPERTKSRPPPQCQAQLNNRGRKGVRASGCKKTEERSATPVRDVPIIPPKRLACIAESLSMHDKMQVIVKLQAYWTLKRRARNGVPLLRRLQLGATPATAASTSEESTDGSGVLTDVMCVKRLRQQMEKVRLLLELIRKRERSKRELIKAHEKMLKLKLEPFAVHLRNIIEELQSHDTNSIFAFPVPAKEAADYAVRIKRPMDFSTMRMKVDKHAYKSFDEFENDFWLIVNNCKAYNEDGSLYYNLAVKLGTQGKVILDVARQSVYAARYCPWTGLLLPVEQLEENASPSTSSVPNKIQSRRRSEHIGKMGHSNMFDFKRRHSIAEVPENKSNTIMHCAVTGEINQKEACVKGSRSKLRWRSSGSTDKMSSSLFRRQSTSMASTDKDVNEGIRTRKQSDSEMGEAVSEINNEMNSVVSIQPVVRKRKRRRKSAYPFPEKVKRAKRPAVTDTEVKTLPIKEVKLQQESDQEKPIIISLPEVDMPDNSPAGTSNAESECRRRTRFSRQMSHEDPNENQLISLGCPARKHRRVYRRSSTANEEDEPPQLSRCPSPVEDVCSTNPESPRCVATRTKNNEDAKMASHPPSLVMSQPHECQTSQVANNESGPDGVVVVNEGKSVVQESAVECYPDKATNERKKCDVETVEISLLNTQPEQNSTVGTSISLPVEVSSLATNGVVVLEDTLDSVVSNESQTCLRTVGAEREGLFEQFLTMSAVVDCDSSYGSTYGRGGAITSDTDTTSSSSPDRAGMCSMDSDGASGSPAHRANPAVDSEGVEIKTTPDIENSCRLPFKSVELEKNSKTKELQKECVCL